MINDFLAPELKEADVVPTRRCHMPHSRRKRHFIDGNFWWIDYLVVWVCGVVFKIMRLQEDVGRIVAIAAKGDR